MEIVVTLEIFGLQILRDKFQRRTHIVSESYLGVGSCDEAHRAAGAFRAGQQCRFHTVLLKCALVQVPELIVTDLADESRRHSEYGRAGDRVGSRASRNVLHAELLQLRPDAVTGLQIHVLHASRRKVVLTKHCLVGKHRQDVRQSVPYP